MFFYLCMFIVAFLLSLLNFLGESSFRKGIMVLSVFGAGYTAIDMYDSGKKISEGLILSKEIKKIDSGIDNITRKTYEIGTSLKDFTTSANTYPLVEVGAQNAQKGYFYIWLSKRGRYNLHGIVITMTDNEKLNEFTSLYHRNPGRLSDYPYFTKKYKISDLYQNELIDSIQIKNWIRFPLQRFIFDIATSTGHFAQSVCFKLLKNNTAGEAWWVRDRFTQLTYDSLLPREFLEHGEKPSDILLH